ncbi:uncharacterized protein LOC106643539 isoform X2 [Copidosoma floridanum]|nr:uncharacterized protein LOC106643539 isoform X2 [Copidosoma floridanum]
MVPFFVATQDREVDMNMAAMPMGGNLALNPVHSAEFNQLAGIDWRHVIPADSRNRFVHKISQALLHHTRNGENSDSRSPKWIAAAKKIEGKAFKIAASRAQYFNILKEEIHKIQSGYGFPAMSSQFPPSSSTTSASAANNMTLVNMSQNYGPNNFGESVSQASIAHSMTSGNLFPDESVVGGGGGMRIPVTSSMGSARPQQFEAFNGRQLGPRSMVHDQLAGNSLQIGFPGEPGPFMSSDQVLASNLLHSMNSLMSPPMNQFIPSALASMGSQQQQQRFGLSDAGPGVLSENSSIMNSQMPGRIQSKEWHKSVTFNIRNRLIRKMAQMLVTIPDPQGGIPENRMHQSICIATSVENEVFRNANSVTQYYDLMAKRCHIIVKERSNHVNPNSLQFINPSDIRRTYEQLGIAYPFSGGPSNSSGNNNGNSNNSNNNNANAGNMRSLHGNNESSAPVATLPGGMPGMMGSGANGPALYGFAHRGQPTQPGQLIGGTLDLNSIAPESIKQLAHAYKCLERENSVNEANEVMMMCPVPFCRDTKNLINHAATCQIGLNCCGPTKDIISHWNHCALDEASCSMCLPVHQAERSLNVAPYSAPPPRSASTRTYHHRFLPSAATTTTTSSASGQMGGQMPVFMRRQHGGRGMNNNSSAYPSTATSGLLTNQSQVGPPPNGTSLRNEQQQQQQQQQQQRITPRSASMWHSNYNDGSWRGNPESNGSPGLEPIRRISNAQRFWLPHRNSPVARGHERRAPYNNPWASSEQVMYVENPRQIAVAVHAPPVRAPSLFGPMPSARNLDRLQPYGSPWRSSDMFFVENARPAHRPAQDVDEPVIIQPEEEATPTEHQQVMAIMNCLKTHGGRLEQKFRCARRSCSASWPCLHRRLAASIQSLETPSPG